METTETAQTTETGLVKLSTCEMLNGEFHSLIFTKQPSVLLSE